MGTDERPVDPERAFRLLSDETRVGILRGLWEASNDAVSFSELRERVGTPDSGQFNYHLGKLREHFVSKCLNADFEKGDVVVVLAGRPSSNAASPNR
jgi:hypothetical protein